MQQRPVKYGTIFVIKSLIATTIVFSLLGYIDYLTGEISIDTLYILCLCIATWYCGTVIGVVSVLEIIAAKISADYFDNIKVGTHLYEWNTFSYLIMYLVLCIVVGSLKKALTK